MKTFIFAAALALTTQAQATLYSMSCTFVSQSTYGSSEAIVNLICDNGWGETKLIGENNSPCLAADNLKNFFVGAKSGEHVQIIGEQAIYSSYSGLEESFDISTATRENSDQVLKAAIVDHHGKLKSCNNTQISISK